MFNQNLVLVGKTFLRVPRTGISSHLRIKEATIFSRFSDTHVFERSTTVECQEILESTTIFYTLGAEVRSPI